jgi:lipopolysaccharide assembly protein A
MHRFKLVAILVLLVLVLVVILQNTEQISTRILFVTVTMPHAALLALTVFIGIVVGVLLAVIMGKSTRADRKE